MHAVSPDTLRQIKIIKIRPPHSLAAETRSQTTNHNVVVKYTTVVLVISEGVSFSQWLLLIGSQGSSAFEVAR